MARGFSETRGKTADMSIMPSLWSAFGQLGTAQANVVNTAVKEQGSTYRTVLKGLVQFDSSMNTGTGAQWMRSLVDLTTAPLERIPASPQLMTDVGLVRAAHPDKLPNDPDIAALIWENMALKYAPAGEQAYGNVQQLKQVTGLYDDAAILQLLRAHGTDEFSVQQAEDMLRTAKLQSDVRDIQSKAQAELGSDMQMFLRQYPDLNTSEAQAAAEQWKKTHTSQLKELQSRLSPEVLQSAAAQLNKPVELTGASKEMYDELQRQREAMLAVTEQPSDRDRAAAIIASPLFQEWAKSNGLSVGHIEQPDPNATYQPGEVVEGVGIYVPGPDDVQAVELAKRQSVMSPDKAHPFMRKGPAQWGSINVATGEPTAPAAPPSDIEEFTGEGNYRYRRINDKIVLIGGPGSEATSAKPIELPPDAQKQAMAENIANRLRKDREFQSAPADAILEVAKATAGDELKKHAAPATPPAEAGKPATTKVYGKLDPMWAGDPIGSRRVNGQLYLYDKASDSYRRAPEQEGLAAPADVTRERVRPFAQAIQEYKDRRATNIARRAEDLEPQQKYPFRTIGLNIAQTLTPTKQTAAEKTRAEEYAYKMEQARRQQETKVDEALPQQPVPVVTPGDVLAKPATPPPTPIVGYERSVKPPAANPPGQAPPTQATAEQQRLLLQRQMFRDKEGDAQLADEERKFSNAARRVDARTPLVPNLSAAPKDRVATAAERAAAQKGYEEVINGPSAVDEYKAWQAKQPGTAQRAAAQKGYEEVINQPASEVAKMPYAAATIKSSSAKTDNLTVPTASTPSR